MASRKVWSRRWVAVMLYLVATLSIEAQPALRQFEADGVEVRLRVDATSLTTSERIIADIDVTAASVFLIDISPPAPPPRGTLSLISATSRGPTVVGPQSMSQGMTVVFAPFLGGNYEIPSFTVLYRTSERSGQITTTPIPVAVRQMIAGDPAVAEPAGVLPVESTSTSRTSTVVAFVVGVIAVFFLALGLVWWRRRMLVVASDDSDLCASIQAIAALDSMASPNRRDLERLFERYRTAEPSELPPELAREYDFIRFGSPSVLALDQFTRALKIHLAESSQARKERSAR